MIGSVEGTRTVYLAGQVARDRRGRLVGPDDLAAQVAQAYLNVDAGLRAVGGGFGDLTELIVHVVDLTRDKIPLVKEGIGRAAAECGASLLRPVTLLGVTSLREPEFLVAVDAVAVLRPDERLWPRETC
ncbi:MAG TPA: Rid family hydrolase [Pseudonocardiaceae bacterium]|nr:Rid family hydrolase [Pseudonocardiaceae bacterium]